MEKEKYGFIYIWYDRKHKRFYIGSHWGKEDDGYICGSAWMHRSKMNRPQDFKRRIIKRVYTNRYDTFCEEQKYLNLIKDEEIGKRYYNLCRLAKSHWRGDPQKTKSVGEKIKQTKANWSPEKREEIRQKYRYKKSSEHRKKIGDFWRGKKKGPLSEETKQKMSLSKKGQLKTEDHKQKLRQANLGKKQSQKTIDKRRASIEANGGIWNRGKKYTTEHRQKLSDAHKGIPVKSPPPSQKNTFWFTNGVINIRSKFCPEGFFKGRTLSEESLRKIQHK